MSVLSITSLTLLVNVCLVPLAVSNVPQLATAPTVFLLSSSRELSVRLPATTDSPLLDQFAKDVLLAVSSVLRTSSVTTVLMASTCTMEPATQSVLPAQLEIALKPTGTVYLVTLPARPA